MGSSPGLTTTQVRDMGHSVEPVLNRVVTSDAHPLPADAPGTAGPEVTLGDNKRYIITLLTLLCNLTQVRTPDSGHATTALPITKVADTFLGLKSSYPCSRQ